MAHNSASFCASEDGHFSGRPSPPHKLVDPECETFYKSGAAVEVPSQTTSEIRASSKTRTRADDPDSTPPEILPSHTVDRNAISLPLMQATNESDHPRRGSTSDIDIHQLVEHRRQQDRDLNQHMRLTVSEPNEGNSLPDTGNRASETPSIPGESFRKSPGESEKTLKRAGKGCGASFSRQADVLRHNSLRDCPISGCLRVGEEGMGMKEPAT